MIYDANEQQKQKIKKKSKGFAMKLANLFQDRTN